MDNKGKTPCADCRQTHDVYKGQRLVPCICPCHSTQSSEETNFMHAKCEHDKWPDQCSVEGCSHKKIIGVLTTSAPSPSLQELTAKTLVEFETAFLHAMRNDDGWTEEIAELKLFLRAAITESYEAGRKAGPIINTEVSGLSQDH